MVAYVLSVLFYRLANGCLVLAISWILLNHSQAAEKNLVWVVVGSFLPALLVAPLTNHIFKYFSAIKSTLIACISIIVFSFFMILFIHNPLIIIILNFLLWCVFFLLESTWEVWFADIVSGVKGDSAKNLNSLTMTISQVSLMLGPLLVGPSLRYAGQQGPFYTAIILYLIVISCILFYEFKYRLSKKIGYGTNSKKIQQKSILEIYKKGPSLFLFASLIFIWPVLGMVNMMLPILGKNRFNGVIDKVALLDAMLSLGMAGAGLFLATFIGKKMFSSKGMCISSILGVFSVFTLCLLIKDFNLMMLIIFIFGFSFGGLRILLRNELLAVLEPAEIGRIIGFSNALGFPVVVTFAFVYGFFPNTGEVSPLMTFLLFFVLIIFSVLLPKKKPIQPEVNASIL
ncbi:MFS transporter [Fluviispira multicolorata]|uniref:MFS transporter n=1 Tax=Fluviispira multicolorata TaxID=2654512 RepID=A0A833JDU0_9BACT|nr:MFS transporter [Fluviispira multicolorata]KAB8032058.1 MFS transporter [Fluviispira multicolorata]